MRGEQVVGSLDDFANRCPKHLPDDAPHTVYLSQQVMSEYTARMWPKRNVVIMDLKGDA
jgi:hypothetical protein